MYGCKKTDLGAGNFAFEAGWIMDGSNQECYYFAGTASINITLNPILTITTTPDAVADPTTFTDGSSQNVHDVRTLVISNAASGYINYDTDLIFVNKTWEAYTPTFDAYTSADVLVVGGVAVSLLTAHWLVKNNTLFINMSSLDIDTLATVRYITISLPTTTLINGKAKRGTAFCRYNTTSTGLSSYVNIELTSGGAGSALSIRKVDMTDYGALSNYAFSFSIAIALI